jgi:hypothetical protein
MVRIMGNGFLFLLVMVATVSAIVTAAEGEIKRNNHKHMQPGAPLNVQEFLNNRRWQGIRGLLASAYSVEKLEKNGGLFFCRMRKHSELHTALSM